MSYYPAIDLQPREQLLATATPQANYVEVPDGQVADVTLQMAVSLTGGALVLVVKDDRKSEAMSNMAQRAQAIFSSGVARELLTAGRWWVVYQRHPLSLADQPLNFEVGYRPDLYNRTAKMVNTAVALNAREAS